MAGDRLHPSGAKDFSPDIELRSGVKKQKAAPPISRRAAITILSGAAVGAALGGTGYEAARKVYNAFENSHQKIELSSTEQVDRDTINHYLIEHNAEENPEEVNLAGLLYPKSQESIPILHEAETFVQNRIRTVDRYMTESSLRLFQETAESLKNHSKNDHLFIETDEPIPTVEKWRYMLTTSQINLTNQILEQVIHVDTAKVVADSSGLGLALSLVRENHHVDTRVNFLNTLDPNLSNLKKLQQISEYVNTNRLTIEAEAFAKQAQATVDALAAGIQSDLPPQLLNIAANYIRFGLNKDNADWLDYVGNTTPMSPPASTV